MFGRQAIGVWIVALATAAASIGRPGSANGATPLSPQEVIWAGGYRIDVTEEEARKYAEQLGLAIQWGRVEDLTRMVDYELIGKIAARGIKPERSAARLVADLQDLLMKKPGGVFDQWLNQKCYFHLLRVTGNGRGRYVLFRVLGPPNDLTYVELALVRSPTGLPVASDVYNFAIGENVTDNLRRLSILRGEETSAVTSGGITSADVRRHQVAIDEFAGLWGEKRYAEATEAFQRLPVEFQRDQHFLNLLFEAAQKTSPDAEQRALELLQKHHSHVPWSYLRLIDHDFVRREYDTGLERVNKLDAHVGGDPFLDTLRAKFLLGKGDMAAAVAAAERAVAAEPTCGFARLELLQAALAAKRFELVRRELRVLESRFKFQADEILKLESSAEFRGSPEFERWKAERSIPETPRDVITFKGLKTDVTDAEAQEFADKLIAALTNRRIDEVNAMVDYDTLADIGVRDASDPAEGRGFKHGFLSTFDLSRGGIFKAALKDNMMVRRLGIKHDANGRHVALRLLSPDGDVNHIELALARGKSGRPVVVDAYYHTVGQNSSDNIRLMFLLGIGEGSKLLSTELSDADSRRAFGALTRIGQLSQNGRFAEVLSEFQNLPDIAKREPFCLVFRMQAAFQVSEIEYRRAIAEIRKYHGNALWANKLLMDDDFLNADYKSALRRLDIADKAIGGDPYLDALRAAALGELKDWTKSLEAAERAIAREPELSDAHFAALNAGLGARRYDIVRRQLLVLEGKFEQDVGAL